MRIGDTGQAFPMDDSHSVGATFKNPTAKKADTANSEYGVIKDSTKGTIEGLSKRDVTEMNGQYLRPNLYAHIEF